MSTTTGKHSRLLSDGEEEDSKRTKRNTTPLLRDSPSSGYSTGDSQSSAYSTANVQNVPSFDAKYLEEEFEKEFPVGRWFDSGNEAFNAVQKWQMSHFNRVRREGRQGAIANQ